MGILQLPINKIPLLQSAVEQVKEAWAISPTKVLTQGVAKKIDAFTKPVQEQWEKIPFRIKYPVARITPALIMIAGDPVDLGRGFAYIAMIGLALPFIAKHERIRENKTLPFRYKDNSPEEATVNVLTKSLKGNVDIWNRPLSKANLFKIASKVQLLRLFPFCVTSIIKDWRAVANSPSFLSGLIKSNKIIMTGLGALGGAFTAFTPKEKLGREFFRNRAAQACYFSADIFGIFLSAARQDPYITTAMTLTLISHFCIGKDMSKFKPLDLDGIISGMEQKLSANDLEGFAVRKRTWRVPFEFLASAPFEMTKALLLQVTDAEEKEISAKLEAMIERITSTKKERHAA